MLIRARRTRTHAAADWTSANPWIEPLEMGIETEAPNKAKINFSDVRVRWNSLEYWNPSGETGGDSGGVQIVTTTVQTNVGTKQALLAAVPTGKVRIVTQVVARNASASLGLMNGDASMGFTADALGWWYNTDGTSFALMTDATKIIVRQPTFAEAVVVGAATELFGIVFTDTAITATLDIDVHYYDVDA